MSYKLRLQNGFEIEYSIIQSGYTLTGTVLEFLLAFSVGTMGWTPSSEFMDYLLSVSVPGVKTKTKSGTYDVYYAGDRLAVGFDVYASSSSQSSQRMGTYSYRSSRQRCPIIILKSGVSDLTYPPTTATLENEIAGVGYVGRDTGTSITVDIKKTSDILAVLADSFQPIGYSITYITNGGTPVPTAEEQTNLPDPLPTTTFPGHVFLGWYTDSSLIYPAVPGAAITADTTLYAGWRVEYPGSGSETGGGEGTYDESSDDIGTATTPLTDVTTTKFLTLWEATATELDTLSTNLWSNTFFDGLIKNQRDPFEALISLKQMPLAPTAIERANVKIGNYTPYPAIPLTRIKQYATLYCGSVDVPEFWGNALDYNGGGTKLEIYLPYIGTRELDPDDFVGGRCHVTYNVDMLTGACVAQIRANRSDTDSGSIDSVLYVFSGMCGVEIPLSGSSHGLTVSNIIAGIAAVGGAVVSVVSGGSALPALGAVAGAAGSVAANANKQQVSRTGGISQNAGIMSPQKPYLIISRPVQQTPDQIKRFSGFPSYVTGELSGFSGFTKVFRVHVDITATEAERDEIENLLKQGVIL